MQEIRIASLNPGDHSGPTEDRAGAPSSKRFWTVVFLAIVFGSADLVRLNAQEFDKVAFGEFRYLGLALGMSALVLLAGVAFVRAERQVTPLLILWLLLGCLLLISAILNESSSGAFGSLWYLIGVPFICFAAIPRLVRIEGEHLLAWGMILGDLPLLAISVIRYPLKYPFMGVTGNPNSMGVIATTVACAFLVLLGRAKVKLGFWHLLFLVAGFLGGTFLTLASGSRTSALTLFGLVILFSADLVSSGSRRLKGTIAASIVAVVIAAGLILALTDGFNNAFAIFGKTEEGRSGFLPQRGQIWAQTLSEGTIFGHGDEYFQENFYLSAHNSIIGVCGQYGILPAAILVILGMAGLISGWRYYRLRRQHTAYSLMPLMIQVCFWGLSMGEGMFGLIAGSINVAFLIAFGMTQYRYRRLSVAVNPRRLDSLCHRSPQYPCPEWPGTSPRTSWRGAL